MKITLEYRNPTPGHCDIAIFVNEALTGTLRLRQEELINFQSIIFRGAIPGLDEVLARGHSLPVEDEE